MRETPTTDILLRSCKDSAPRNIQNPSQTKSPNIHSLLPKTLLKANSNSTTYKIQILNARVELQSLPYRTSACVSTLGAPL
jgi:hypothetical protein